jgi:putative spermidine/putrescine transport system substrate-binding protein
MHRRTGGVLVAAVLLAAALFFVTAVPDTARAGGSKEEQNLLGEEFSAIREQARGTTVRFYMWGGSSVINSWVDGFVTDELAERYAITLERVPMDAPIFVNKLLTERQAGRERGNIDLVWINGENFRNAMEAGLLYGPIADMLPSFDYVDPESVAFDFGYPVNGFEAPYGRAQFVFEYDTARFPEPPRSFEELLAWVQRNPGRFTYPQPPDFTGSAFIRQVFYAVTGGHEQYMDGYDQELFDRNAPLLWEFLNEMEPFLWQKGGTYPKDVAALDTLFARGEVDFSMSYHQAHAQNNILTGLYPGTVRTFVMENNSIFNTHFTAVPFNAPNKAGALVTADFLLSVDAQVSKNMPSNWGDFTVLDMNRLPDGQRERFENIELGPATLDLETLAQNQVPEIPSGYLEALEAGWEEHVLRK